MRLLSTIALSALFLQACAAEVADNTPNRDKLGAGASAGRDIPADHWGDPCLDNGWYGDGECDTFCPLADEDCDDGSFCAAALCGPGTSCSEEERRCVPTNECSEGYRFDETALGCVPNDPGFCTRALCGPGYQCDEEIDACVAASEFCPAAFCPPGTLCDEEIDACVAEEPEGDFCPRALCGPGYDCDEELDACVASEDFCPRALCGPGYVCNENTDACEPEADFCPRALCGPGHICNEDTNACERATCENSCTYANDGECDDGGMNSLYSACALGTDCADCGPR